MAQKGQAFTLEAFFASIIILSAVTFALASTVVTPLSDTSGNEVQNTEGAAAQSFLEATDREGSLKRMLLAWDSSTSSWVNTTSGSTVYADKDDVPGRFGEKLRTQFGDDTAVNVEVIYSTSINDARPTTERTVGTQTMINQGTPSENAQSAETQVVLTQTDFIHEENPRGVLVRDTDNGYTIGEHDDDGDEYYAPDVADVEKTTGIYNAVTIRVTVWRI